MIPPSVLPIQLQLLCHIVKALEEGKDAENENNSAEKPSLRYVIFFHFILKGLSRNV